jgi:hypothetical protein
VKVAGGGVGGRRMTLGGAAGRVTNPTWMTGLPTQGMLSGPVKAAPTNSEVKGGGGKRGWR